MGNKHGVSAEDQKKYGNVLLKHAFIPKSNWDAVAKGISEHTDGKVSVEAATEAIKACDTNDNGKLSYKESFACLKKHQKALGLGKIKNNKAAWETAKWELAKAAVITKKGLKK